MGGKQSSMSQQSTDQRSPRFLNSINPFSRNPTQQSQFQQPGTVIPQQPSNFQYLEFILKNPPVKVTNLPQQTTPTNQSQNTQKLNSLREAIIQYNRIWNFGNQPNGQPQSLLKDQTYESFKSFVNNLLTNQSGQNSLPQEMENLNRQSFQEKKEIVKKIHDLLQGNYSLVNRIFDVKISDIFPNMGLKEFVPVSLLDLASIIGAEHIVIYLLMCGTLPGLSNRENKDSATLMLEYQILLFKSQSQQQPLSFIVLPRILYVLFLLGSVRDGVDLSAIFETKEQKNKENLSGIKKGVKVRSSILNMLAQMPGIQSAIPVDKQTLQNGGSALLLLEIIGRNNEMNRPKFFKEINSLEIPYDLNVLYNVLLNKTIDDQTKISLVKLLVLKCNANIANVPTFTSNLVKKSGNTPNINLNTFKKIEFLVSVSVKDIKNIKPILEIFSQKNPDFAAKLKQQYGNDLKGLNSISKNSAKSLMQIIDLLRQKNAIMAAEFDKFLENYYRLRVDESVAKAQIYALVEQSPNLTGLPSQSNPVKGNLSQIASSVLSGQPQMQSPGTSLNPVQPFQQMQTGPIGSINSEQQQMQPAVNSLNPPAQKKKGFLSGFSLSSPFSSSKKNNIKQMQSAVPPLFPSTVQLTVPPAVTSTVPLAVPLAVQPAPISAMKNSSISPVLSQQGISELKQPNLLTSFSKPLTSSVISNQQLSLQQAPLISPPNLTFKANNSKPLLSSNSKKSKGLFSGLFGRNNKNKGQTAAQTIPPISPTLPPPLEPKRTFGNRATNFLGIGKKKNSTLIQQNPQTNTTPLLSSQVISKNKAGGQAGGKQIQMRTYHFLKHKKYSERAFIAERPIIAADNAYDFMKLHYDIGSKKITFTIHDRVNNKKYKYTARTLKDGTNVIKSAK